MAITVPMANDKFLTKKTRRQPIMHDHETSQTLNQASFNNAFRLIVEKALTKDTPYCTAIIWTHSKEQQDWGKILTQEIADDLGQDNCLRKVDRIIFLYVASMDDFVPLGTIIWLINYHDPQCYHKDIPSYCYDKPSSPGP